MTTPDRPGSVRVTAQGPLSGAVAAPASKSLTNRALITAALAQGRSVLRGPLLSDDVGAMRQAAASLGASVADAGGDLVVDGTGGVLRPAGGPIEARLSGTTMRFVTAVAALAPETVVVTGDAPLLRRPIGPLVAALRALGASAQDRDGFPPVAVGGGLDGGEVAIDVTASSQFASAVLLVAPYARNDVIVDARGDAADAYITLTVDLMQRWGADVEEVAPRRWRVTAGRGYAAREESVEYDASAAAHLYALAAASGGCVTVTNVAGATAQPDAGITAVLRAMGCEIDTAGSEVTVRGPQRLRATSVDLGAMPDQVTTVAALMALAEGTSTISGVAVTRGHETDRIAALARELSKLGVDVEEYDDGLAITGGTARGPATLETYDDHRLAMAFAAVAVAVPAVVISDPGCVGKTYPDFWDVVGGLGAGVRFGD